MSVLKGGLSEKTMKEMKKKVRGAPRPKPKNSNKGICKRCQKEVENKDLDLSVAGICLECLVPREKMSVTGTQTGRSSSKKPNIEERAKKPKFISRIDRAIIVNGVAIPTKPLTVEEAMELIGWTVVEDGQFHLRDIHGSKIRLANNTTNRPFRIGLANRYKSEILRNKWCLNGESIVIDWDGKMQSGQHRICGFILAEEERRENKGAKDDQPGWKDKCQIYWKRGGPLTLPAIVVQGVDPKTADTLDLGQKRSMGDVFYREGRFDSGLLPGHGQGKPAASVEKGKRTAGKPQPVLATPPISDVTRKQLCNILSGATRLVWLRAGGKSVTDAPHFPHSEALDFINANERLEEVILYIWGLEGGSGKGGCQLSRFTTLAYAAGLCYLMMTSGTDEEDYKENGSLDFSMEKKAKEFWAKMASGAKLDEDDPIHLVRQALPQVDAGSGIGRDEVVGMIIKAFNLYADGQKATTKDVTMRKEAGKLGKPQLTEAPRLGGLDIEGPAKLEHPDTQKMEDTREGSMSDPKGQDWAEGDTAWVRADDGEHWFGSVDEIIKRPLKDGGSSAILTDTDTGRQWEEPIKNLWLKYPG